MLWSVYRVDANIQIRTYHKNAFSFKIRNDLSLFYFVFVHPLTYFTSFHPSYTVLDEPFWPFRNTKTAEVRIGHVSREN